MATLTPVLSGSVPNPNVGYCNGWIPITNDQNRPMFAMLTYSINGGSSSGGTTGIVNGQVSILSSANVLPVSAVALGTAYTITSLPTSVQGTPRNLAFSVDNSALLAQIPNLERTADFVTAYPPQNATIAGTPFPSTTIGTVFTAKNRSMMYIQNLATAPLLCALSGVAANNNYQFVLRACTADSDGTGGVFTTDTWLGSLSVTGTNVKYVAWEM